MSNDTAKDPTTEPSSPDLTGAMTGDQAANPAAPGDQVAPDLGQGAVAAPDDQAPGQAPVPDDAPAPPEPEPEPATEPVAAAAPADAPAAEAGVTQAEAEPEPAPQAEATPEPEPQAEAGTGAAPEREPGADPAAAKAVPQPLPRPRPRPGARPGAPSGAKGKAKAKAEPAMPQLSPISSDGAEAQEAATFGRVEADGTVLVREAAGERAVGQFPGASREEALALYVRRFLDLKAQVNLLSARLAMLAPAEIDTALNSLSEELAEPAVVGDLDALRAQLEDLRGKSAELKAQAEARRKQAKAQALAERTALVEAAEALAAADPAKTQWKQSGEKLRELLDQWKAAQRSGPRIDRGEEDALWKRFSKARTTFDHNRHHYFQELDKRSAEAKARKLALVEQAEKLKDSSDWGATAGAYRDLMDQWRAAGRASRKDDDALWARFRAAQDAFFERRHADAAATDAEQRANLEAKQQLAAQAEALLPVKDIKSARAALRHLQEQWEEIGKVPRADMHAIEGRMRAVEQAVRDAESGHWKRTNPETKARASGAQAQLEAAIAELEAALAAASAAGDTAKAEDLSVALAARRSWLEQVAKTAREFG